MKVQIVTPYRVSHLQRYGVTVRGNATGVYRPIEGFCLILRELILIFLFRGVRVGEKI
jgi:hypothetical protein